jgi:hypothetical protein
LLNGGRSIHKIVSDDVVDNPIPVVIDPISVGRVETTVVVEVFFLVDPELVAEVGMIEVKSRVDYANANGCRPSSGRPSLPCLNNVEMIEAVGKRI